MSTPDAMDVRELRERIRRAYDLVKAKLTKKVQAELASKRKSLPE